MAILKKSERLKKELGLWDVYALATGTTLSAGFFLLPGLAAKGTGPALPLAYLIAALPLVPAVFSILELATAMPRAGGVYYFLDRSLGPMIGMIGGIGTWLAVSLKAAFALVGMGAYIHLFLPSVDMMSISVASALFFGVVNIQSARHVGLLQLSLVIGLLAILTWFSGGIFKIHTDHFANFFGSGLDSIVATGGLVYISYVGVTKVASISEEIRDPEHNLPRAVFLSLLTTLGIYVVGTTVMVGVVPLRDLAGNLTPVATAAGLLAGRIGVFLVVVAALLAFSSVANAGILSASRYPLAMSRDGMAPAVFGRLSHKNIPLHGVCATVGLILVFLLLLEPVKIAKLASAFQLLLFALICLAVIVMRESKIESYDPAYRSPLYPWMQIAGVVLAFWLIALMGWLPTAFTAGLVGVSLAWYFYYARRRVERGGAILHVFERLGRSRFHGLDTELRGILKEKGLRREDPFDEIVARARVIDEPGEVDYESAARKAATLLAERVPAGAEEILEGYLRGTRIGMTPVSHGAALPHLRLPGLPNSEMVLVRASQGMRIEAADELGRHRDIDQPVQAAFFFISPEDNPGQHLRILAQVAERVDDEGFMADWLSAGHELQLKEALLHNERFLPVSVDPAGAAADLMGKSLAELGFPAGCLVALVHRDEFTFVPRATTVIQAGDRITIIGEPGPIAQLGARLRERER